MKPYVPIVPDNRLLEIIRGFMYGQVPDPLMLHMPDVCKDMRSEEHLLQLGRLIVDECQARLPLWELEAKAAELEKELAEEARLNAMGAEREARLMARVAELEGVLKELTRVFNPNEQGIYKFARPLWQKAVSLLGGEG